MEGRVVWGGSVGEGQIDADDDSGACCVDDGGGGGGGGVIFRRRRVRTCGIVVVVPSVFAKNPSSPVVDLNWREYVWMG